MKSTALLLLTMMVSPVFAATASSASSADETKENAPCQMSTDCEKGDAKQGQPAEQQKEMQPLESQEQAQ